jgi:MFS family permease
MMLLSQPRRRLSPTAIFWSSAAVIALCLWSSGSPTVLYPSYAARWHLSPTVITTVFATYPAVLVLMLLTTGSISDRIGRRATMRAGLVALVLATVVFVAAPAEIWLYVGRALQGGGTGLALAAATASLTEHNPTRDGSRPGSVTTLANSGGLAAACVVPALFLQFAPAPLRLSFVGLLVLLLVALAAVQLMPSDRPVTESVAAKGFRLQPIGVPRGMRATFAITTLAANISFAMGALMLSLGAQLTIQILHTADALTVGATLATIPVAAAIASRLLRNVPQHIATTGAAALATVALVLLYLSNHAGSLALLLASMGVGGVSYALGFMGGLRTIGSRAPAHHRAKVLSAFYFCMYVVQGVSAVSAGLVATDIGLERTLSYYIPVVAGLGVIATVLAGLAGASTRRRTARQLVPAL